MARETSREIDTAAAGWAARLDAGALSTEDAHGLDDWLAGDTRRRGAFMRLRAVALHSERARALGPGFDPEAFADAPAAAEAEEAVPLAEARIGRRRFLWLGASAAAACAVGAIGLGLTSRAEAYETRLGETRVVTLEDGSVITLNTSSRVTVAYASDRRLVTLDHGEALFDVARDPKRPFVVAAGGTEVRAVGTSFTVKRLAGAPVEILVRQGTVDVVRAAAPRPVRMAANTRVVATDGTAALAPAQLAPEEVARELAWRTGQVAFEGETLANAATTFARYSETRIVIDDPAVGREEITGLFAANDPVSFARAAATSLDLQVRVGPGEVRLSR